MHSREKHAVPGAQAGLVGIDGSGVKQNGEPDASASLRRGNLPCPSVEGLHRERIDREVHTALGAIGDHVDFPVLPTRAAAVVHDQDVDGVAAFAKGKGAAQSDFLFQFVGSICESHVRSHCGQTIA